MDPNTMTTEQVLLYAALFNVGIGFLVGLVPLILGFVKGNKKPGIIGFILSIVGGALLGIILSVPVAAIFTWLVVRDSKTSKTLAGGSETTDI